jgi:hypothetical protein
MYVFDYSEDPDYLEIAGFGLPHVYAGPTFFEWLLTGQLLEEIDEQSAHDEDLIVYFENGKWKHVGFWRLNDRVESKWSLGLLYNHGRWEVPSYYGDQVRFFDPFRPRQLLSISSGTHNPRRACPTDRVDGGCLFLIVTAALIRARQKPNLSMMR